MDEFAALRELVTARFDALEARMIQMYTQVEKENQRQDEAIERLADRTPPISEFNRLAADVASLERKLDKTIDTLNQVFFKVRVTWAIGAAIATLIVAVLTAYVQRWIGV